MMQKSLFNKIKEAGSHTLIYGLGSVLQSLLSFIMLPIYTRAYTTELYGVFSLLTMCSTIVGAVFFLGASSALARSYFDYEDGYERKKVVSTSLYITLIGAAVQILFGVFASDYISRYLFHSSEYSMAVKIVLISSALGFINNLFYIVLRFQRRSVFVIIVNLLSFISTASLILYFLYYLNLEIMAPVLGMFLGQLFILCILAWSIRKSIVLAYSKYELKVQMLYGVPTVFTGLAFYTLDWIDRLFINKYCTLNDVGIYSAAYKLGMIIQAFFIIPFSQIWAPMRMEYRYDNNASEFYRLITSYYFLFGVSTMIVLSTFSKELIVLITGKEAYFEAYRVIPIVMLAHLLYGFIGIIDNGIIFSRKVIWYVYIFWTAVIFKIILCYMLIPRYGFMAAAYIALISYGFTLFFVFLVSNRLYQIKFEGVRLLKIFLCGAIVYGLVSMVSGEIDFVNCLLKIGILIFALVFMYIFVLDQREKSRIAAAFGKG